MSEKPKKRETLDEKIARVRRKAEARAQVVAGLLTSAQQDAAIKLKEKGEELLDTIDELLGEDE